MKLVVNPAANVEGTWEMTIKTQDGSSQKFVTNGTSVDAYSASVKWAVEQGLDIRTIESRKVNS